MDFFFNPKSVAVVGASRNPMKFGSVILANLFNLEYGGRIFPVNPKGEDIAGTKTYTSVASIPDEVELAILAIPASAVVNVIKECAEKGVRGAVIIASGFRESGEAGVACQDEIVRIARSAGMRIVGPNTTGILNPHDNFTTTFVPLRHVRKGSVAFIAQTGMFAGMLLEWILSTECFGISKVAGLGNKCDVDDADALDYLTRDEHTRVIMMYVETVKDGRRFMEAAGAATRVKPVLALKSGRTGEGAAAAMSHTGSIAGNDEIVSGAFRQAGVIRVDSFQDLIDGAKMLSFQPVARGNRLAIVSLSGGAAVMSSDAAVRAGFRLADFPETMLAPIQKKYPAWATLRHPFDIEPLTETVGFEPAFEMTVRCALSNPGTDACVVITWTPFVETGFSFDFIRDLQSEYPGKPVAFCSVGYKDSYETLFERLEALQIPVYPSFKRAVDSLAVSAEYGRYLSAVGAPGEWHYEQASARRSDRESTNVPSRDDGSNERPRRLRIFFDGASKGNPGPAAIGAVLYGPSGETVRELGEPIGKATNNFAEYSALIRALEEAKKLGIADVECLGDSELIIKQMNGVYRVKSPALIPLAQKAMSLSREFDSISFRHVPRSQNRRADRLASDVLQKGAKEK